MKIKIKRLDRDIPLPSYRFVGEDAGLDLYSREEGSLSPLEYRLFGTGIEVAIPNGYAGFIHPRSGLALHYGITVLNAGGVIDAGYRGEVGVILINHSQEKFTVKRGDRIAQLIITEISIVFWEEVDKLPSSRREEGGFGHSGVRDES